MIRIHRRCGPAFAAAPCMLLAALVFSCNDECICPPPCPEAPVCEISPPSVDFGDLDIGQHTDTTVAIINIGEDSLTCAIGLRSPHYEILSGAGTHTLGTHDRLDVKIRFRPDTLGPLPCSIETGCVRCDDIACTGVGIELSVCEIEPATLSFGVLRIPEGRVRSFVVRNAGEGVIRGEISESSDQYEILDGEGEYVLGPGESRSVIVGFNPTLPGRHICTIETGTCSCTDVLATGEAQYSWIPIESGTTSDLRGVWGSSDSDIVAVGSAGTIIRYDGSAWHGINSGTSFALEDVWGTADFDIFIVGASRTILHHNGYSWNFMFSPAAGDIRGVFGGAWNNVFAVGNGIVRYNGSAWEASLDVGWSLNDVWVHSETEAYAVDSSGTVLRYAMQQWRAMDSGIYIPLYAVWASSPNDIFVAGDDGAIYHFDGEKWLRMHTSLYSEIYAIWGRAPDDIYAAGRYFTVLHYDGSAWATMLRTGTWDQSFYDIWGDSRGRLFAVGSGGVIFRYGPWTD